MTEFDLKRHKANKAILRELDEFMFNNPSLRFSQVLIHLGITNEFEAEGIDHEYKFEVIDWNEEPFDQLNRIQINKHI